MGRAVHRHMSRQAACPALPGLTGHIRMARIIRVGMPAGIAVVPALGKVLRHAWQANTRGMAHLPYAIRLPERSPRIID